MYAAITRLPHISAIKIPGAPFGSVEEGAARLARLRAIVPEHVAVGVSADKFGVAGMLAGCDCWLSVAGGLFPSTIKSLIVAVHHVPHRASEKAATLTPLWEQFVQPKGGLRIMATAADILGYTEGNCLPAPPAATHRPGQRPTGRGTWPACASLNQVACTTQSP